MVHYTLYKTTWGESRDKEYKRKYTDLIDAKRNAIKLFMKDVDTAYVQIYKYTDRGSDLYAVIGEDKNGFYYQSAKWSGLGKKQRMDADGWTR